jgi:hypothetical protein
MGIKPPKIPGGCQPKEIRSKSRSLVSNEKRFVLSIPDEDDLRSWLRILKIAAFNPRDSRKFSFGTYTMFHFIDFV